MWIFKVPTAKTYYLEQITAILADSAKTMNVQINVYNGTLITENYDVHAAQTEFTVPIAGFPGIPADSMIWANANISGSADTATLSGGGFLVDD
jgi:hypothetical protein